MHTAARLYLTRLSRFAHNRIATHCSNFKTEPLSRLFRLVHGPSHAKFTSRINEQEDFLPHIATRAGSIRKYSLIKQFHAEERVSINFHRVVHRVFFHFAEERKSRDPPRSSQPSSIFNHDSSILRQLFNG